MHDPDQRYRALAKILTDLDRCEHGRHAIGSCLSCPDGRSAGNRFLPGPGERVGTDLYGAPYVMPGSRGERALGSTGDPENWRPGVDAPARA
jgi:hypothetical protein